MAGAEATGIFGPVPDITGPGMFGPVPDITGPGMFGPVPDLYPTPPDAIIYSGPAESTVAVSAEAGGAPVVAETMTGVGTEVTAVTGMETGAAAGVTVAETGALATGGAVEAGVGAEVAAAGAVEASMFGVLGEFAAILAL